MILMIRDPTEMILMLRDLKWPDPLVLVAPLAEVIAAQVMIAGPMNKPQRQVLVDQTIIRSTSYNTNIG